VVARVGELVAQVHLELRGPVEGAPKPSAAWLATLAEATVARLEGRRPDPLPALPTVPLPRPPTGFLSAQDFGSGWIWRPGVGGRSNVSTVDMPAPGCRNPTTVQADQPGRLVLYTSMAQEGRYWTLEETVVRLEPGDAQRVVDAYRSDATCPGARLLASGPGIAGDDAVVVGTANSAEGGPAKAAIRVGDTLILLKTRPGGAGVGNPLPGRPAWMTAIAKKAAERYRAAS
jgi:hypothetical protein